MKKFRCTLALAALVLLGLCGCRSVEKEQSVRIESTPAGAQVSLDGLPLGNTPISVSLPTFYDSTLVLSKTGFIPQSVTVGRNGARSLRPNPVRVQLEPSALGISNPGYERACAELKRQLETGEMLPADKDYAQKAIERHFRK